MVACRMFLSCAATWATATDHNPRATHNRLLQQTSQPWQAPRWRAEDLDLLRGRGFFKFLALERLQPVVIAQVTWLS
jgi:hypothetical protein